MGYLVAVENISILIEFRRHDLSDSNKSKKTRNLVIISLMTCCLLFCTIVAWAASHNRVTVMEASEMICDNLLKADLVDSHEQCVITSNYSALIYTMFPLGVSKEYVQTGMSSLELVNESRGGGWLRYGIQKNIFGNPAFPWIDFLFDQEYKLKGITIQD